MVSDTTPYIEKLAQIEIDHMEQTKIKFPLYKDMAELKSKFSESNCHFGHIEEFELPRDFEEADMKYMEEALKNHTEMMSKWSGYKDILKNFNTDEVFATQEEFKKELEKINLSLYVRNLASFLDANPIKITGMAEAADLSEFTDFLATLPKLKELASVDDISEMKYIHESKLQKINDITKDYETLRQLLETRAQKPIDFEDVMDKADKIRLFNLKSCDSIKNQSFIF